MAEERWDESIVALLARSTITCEHSQAMIDRAKSAIVDSCLIIREARHQAGPRRKYRPTAIVLRFPTK